MRFHRPAPVLIEHHEVLLPAVQRREELLELVEAHLARVISLRDVWLSFNNQARAEREHREESK